MTHLPPSRQVMVQPGRKACSQTISCALPFGKRSLHKISMTSSLIKVLPPILICIARAILHLHRDVHFSCQGRLAGCVKGLWHVAGASHDIIVTPYDSYGNAGASGGRFAAELASEEEESAPAIPCQVTESTTGGVLTYIWAASDAGLQNSGGTQTY